MVIFCFLEYNYLLATNKNEKKRDWLVSRFSSQQVNFDFSDYGRLASAADN